MLCPWTGDEFSLPPVRPPHCRLEIRISSGAPFSFGNSWLGELALSSHARILSTVSEEEWRPRT
jgi:hypothetical protein